MIWIDRVSTGPECDLVIEDGRIREDATLEAGDGQAVLI